jgi:hypothetical protein
MDDVDAGEWECACACVEGPGAPFLGKGMGIVAVCGGLVMGSWGGAEGCDGLGCPWAVQGRSKALCVGSCGGRGEKHETDPTT